MDCETKRRKGIFKNPCTRSNILYTATCVVCEKKFEDENNKIEEERIRKKEKENRRKECIYIGESSKSMYTRAPWHMLRKRGLHSDSFWARHWVRFHPEMELEDIEMNFSVKRFHRKALERMIDEAITIRINDKNSNKITMNNKSEFSRTIVPDTSQQYK